MGDLWIFLEFGISKILYLKPKFLIIGPKKNPKQEQIVIFIIAICNSPLILINDLYLIQYCYVKLNLCLEST